MKFYFTIKKGKSVLKLILELIIWSLVGLSIVISLLYVGKYTDLFSIWNEKASEPVPMVGLFYWWIWILVIVLIILLVELIKHKEIIKFLNELPYLLVTTILDLVAAVLLIITIFYTIRSWYWNQLTTSIALAMVVFYLILFRIKKNKSKKSA